VEEDSYRLGFAELCAAGVGAPHIRQRLFWVADTGCCERGLVAGVYGDGGGLVSEWPEGAGEPSGRCTALGLPDAPERGRGEQRGADQPGRSGYADGRGAAGGLADTQDANRRAGERGAEEGTWPDGERRRGLAGGGFVGGLDFPKRQGLEERDGQREQQLRQDAEPVAAGAGGVAYPKGMRDIRKQRNVHEAKWGPVCRMPRESIGPGEREPFGLSFSAWSDFDILHCLDGKSRRTQSGLFPLAYGVSGRVAIRRAGQEHWYSRTGTLRGFGNAIVPQVAAEFIRAYIDVA
jgi:DNA (cytosine-5)-methyltransferase 1